ncbi:MAG: 8-oxo-dGTP diphosphatase [Oceanospirillaceae bacterium]|jgi:8-oxo-dGTP diphosphatase
MKKIHVVAAVIFNSTGQVYLTKRPLKVHQGGLWEFPGGKVEVGESQLVALHRELLEELGIEINSAKAFISIPFEYPDKAILLDVFTVDDYQGEPWGKEGQQGAWFALADLAQLEFPAANKPILEKLRLTYAE